VARIAASAFARDETNIPVTAVQPTSRVRTRNRTSSGSSRPTHARNRRPFPPPFQYDQLRAQLAEFIGALEKAPAGAEGRITLPALRQLGVAVRRGSPGMMNWTWPWGEATLARSGANGSSI
jgi:hypothetical protein